MFDLINSRLQMVCQSPFSFFAPFPMQQPVKSYTKDYFQHEMASWFTEATVGEKRMQIYSTIMRLHKRSQPDDQTVWVPFFC